MNNKTGKYTNVLALAAIIVALTAIIITIVVMVIALCLTATGQITAISAESHAEIAQRTLNTSRDLVKSFPGSI